MEFNLDVKEGKRESRKVNGTNYVLQCSGCDKKLGILVESDKPSKISDRPGKYRCICSCGSDSFSITSSNTCYFVPEPSLKITAFNFLEKPKFVEYITTLEKV